MKLTKSKLKQVIMEGLFDAGDDKITNALEKLLTGINSLDTSIDYLSAIMSGESPLTMQYGQAALGRLRSPVRGAKTPVAAALKEEGTKPNWGQHLEEAIANLYGTGCGPEEIREMVATAFDAVMGEMIDEKKTKVSKKGQKRVSKKIAHLVGDEDKSQEQAAAIAYSMEERGELK
jgi:hypothetical protein